MCVITGKPDLNLLRRRTEPTTHRGLGTFRVANDFLDIMYMYVQICIDACTCGTKKKANVDEQWPAWREAADQRTKTQLAHGGLWVRTSHGPAR